MCVNYRPTRRELFDYYGTTIPPFEWPSEVYQDYQAPIIISNEGNREPLLASYGMIPKSHIPEHVKHFTTMNARSETVATLRSYSKPWRESRLCLIPLEEFFEPNYESGKHVRWGIGMADNSPFAVAGLWKAWEEPDGTISYSFTQLTINADEHTLMKRFHKPGDEKRSLVILPPENYDDWLNCKNPEVARTFLQLYPSELMSARPAPKPPKKAVQETIC